MLVVALIIGKGYICILYIEGSFRGPSPWSVAITVKHSIRFVNVRLVFHGMDLSL